MGIRRPTLGAVLAIVAAAVACGGGGERESVELSMITGELCDNAEFGGFAFDGEEFASPGPTITVPAGAEVTIALENRHGQFSGETFPHDLVVVADKDAVPAEPLFGADTGAVLPEGSESDDVPTSASITFTADEPGSYFYICSVTGHVGRGMFGEFVVEG